MAKKAKSDFEGAVSLISSIVVPGSKVSGYAVPTLSADTVKDKFTLDSKSLDLMGIKEGDKVTLFDKGEADENGCRFLIGLSYGEGDEEVGAKIGANSSFSYSKIWGAMQMNEDGKKEFKTAELIKAGILVQRETAGGKNTVSATQKITFEVAPYKVNDEVIEEAVVCEDGTKTKIWALVDRGAIGHTPRA